MWDLGPSEAHIGPHGPIVPPQRPGTSLGLGRISGMRQRAEITVYGEAQPAGSKKGFVNKRDGRVIIVDANSKSGDWKKVVAQAAGEQWRGGLMDGPIRLTMVQYRPRPSNHYGTGRNAGVRKDSAPYFPITRPDVLKIARGIEDALTGVLYRDDSQIVDEHLMKRYGEPARVEVIVEQVVDDLLLGDGEPQVRPEPDTLFAAA